MADKRRKQPPERHQKFNIKRNRSKGEENAESVTRKTIVDIDNDCLEYVFNFLEFRDLINLADANVHIRVAAEAVFLRKLKKRIIIVEIERCECPDIDIYDDAISIHTSLLAVKTIRNFRQSIKGIYLKIKTNDFLREKFFLHVNEYCHKTLNVLQTFGDHSHIFDVVKHPFANVEEFSSHKGVIGPGCEHLNRIFPRLHKLEFIDNDIMDLKCIARTYPSVKDFAFNYKWEFPNNFNDGDLITITTLNPQIETFKLVSYHKPSIWGLIRSQVQNLKNIHASYWLEHAHSFKGSPIQFSNIEIFDVSSKYLSSVNPIEVFSFNHLKKFKIYCEYNGADIWMDFVLAHPTIEQLEIAIHGWIAWFMYEEMFQQICPKLNKIRQNMRLISLQLNGFTFYKPYCSRHTLKLLKFLLTQMWFDKVSVVFTFPRTKFKALNRMDLFAKEVLVLCAKELELKSFMEMYKIKKYILSDKPHVDFEKYEQ